MAILRSGIDLVEIDRLANLRPEIRARFLARVFTPGELADANDLNASLAGRFAVKEAVAKALGTGIGRLGWQQIETRRGERDEPMLCLYGEALAEAERLGLRTWSISISHTRAYAVAVAVGMGAE